MSRMLSAFLVLAVIAGIVLAVNPQVREQAENTWQEYKPIFVEFQNSLEVKFRDVFLRDES